VVNPSKGANVLSRATHSSTITAVATPNLPHGSDATTRAWPTMGCVLLLCALAARPSRASAYGRMARGPRSHQVVVRNAISTVSFATPQAVSFATPQAPPAHVYTESIEVKQVPVASPETLLRRLDPQPSATADAPRLSSLVSSQSSPPATATSDVAQQQPETKETPSARSAKRAGPALFAGGMRHTRPRRAHRSATPGAASRATRAARRSMGARLQPAYQYPPVATPSFDPSRLRSKVQAGLRVMQHMPAKRPREFQTPSTSNGVSDQAGAIVGMLQKNRSLHSTPTRRTCRNIL